MTNSEKELLALLSSYLNGARAETVQNVDFPELMRLSENHKITPIIYASAKSNRRAYNSSPNAPDILKSASFAQISLQIQKSRSFISIYKKLSEGGICALVIKGAVLRNIYPEPDLRISSDEDILIPISQLGNTRRIFLENGFTENKAADEDTVHTFVSGDKILHIEVHTALFPPYPKYNEKLNSLFQNVFSETASHEIEGTRVLSLSHTSHLLFLLLHSVKHFIYCGFGIRQVTDFAVYARTYREQINTKEIVTSLEKVSAVGFLSGILSICKNYLSILPEDMGFNSALADSSDPTELLSDILSSGAYGNSSEERVHSSAVTMASADGDESGIKSFLFPSYEAMKGRYSFLKGRRYLLPAAWCMRIASHLFKKRRSRGPGSTESLEIGKKRLDMLKKYGIIYNERNDKNI